MSVVLRYLCATLVLLVAIHCSQEFSIGYGPESENDSPLEEGRWNEEIDEDKTDFYVYLPLQERRDFLSIKSPLQIGRSILEDNESVAEEDDVISTNEKRSIYKRRPFVNIGKRATGYDYMPQSAFGGDKTFLRIGRNPSDSTFLRIGRAPNDRTFLRFGRPSDRTFLRIGRAPGDKTFLRIGRANVMQDDTILAEDTEDLVSDANDDATGDFDMEKRYGSGLRIGKRWPRIGKRMQLRIGKRLLKTPKQNVQSVVTPEDIQLILENKELLLKLLEKYPDLLEDDNQRKPEYEEAYFAFPRQGRAMSFFFPRMGRSGSEETTGGYCCEEGVRSIIGQSTLRICPPEQSCCPGLKEKNNVYRNILITECVAENDMDRIRAYIGDE